jgi:DNA-binding NarL/FixJ family response regulator
VTKPTSKAKSPSSAPLKRSRLATSSGAPASDASDFGVRVLCVDDHMVLVEGLKAQFAIDGRLHVVGRLASAESLLLEVDRVKPDVVLLDIEMPGPDVFEMADRMRHQHPRLRFAFLSAHIRDGYLAAAYACGAWGYFAKSDDLEDIVAGIKEIAQSTSGTFVMGPKVKQRCAQASNTQPPSKTTLHEPASKSRQPVTMPLASLTSREIEILRLIGKGMSRVEIGKELSRSAKTIDGHQERLLKKLGFDSRADLMRFAIREGLAEA